MTPEREAMRLLFSGVPSDEVMSIPFDTVAGSHISRLRHAGCGILTALDAAEARILELEANAVDAHRHIDQIRKQAARECAEIAEAGAKQAALGVHRECEHDDCSEQRAIVKGARDTAKAIRERFGLEGK